MDELEKKIRAMAPEDRVLLIRILRALKRQEEEEKQ